MIPASEQSIPERLRAIADKAVNSTLQYERILDIRRCADEIERQQAELATLKDAGKLLVERNTVYFNAARKAEAELERHSECVAELTAELERLREIHDGKDYKNWLGLNNQIKDRLLSAQYALARYSNPWTVEILNQESNNWESFAHDAPLTLANAESRAKEHQTENPDAKFRVTPWLNLDQRQVVERLRGERELFLAALMEIAHASTGVPDGIGYDHHGNCNLSDCRCSNHIVCQAIDAARDAAREPAT